MTTIIPEQPSPEQSVYVDAHWDPMSDTWSRGHGRSQRTVESAGADLPNLP